MSETFVKMSGMAMMSASVFAMLFGLYLPEVSNGLVGTVLVVGGAAAFFVGLILFAALRKD